MTDKTPTDELRELLDELKEAYLQELDDVADCSRRGTDRCMEFGSCYECMGATIEAVEQAVEATLGPDPREHGLIPHFWTGDETLHIDLGKLPERIDVTLPDKRGREVYSARVHRFEPEREECRNDSLKRGAGVFVCSECGAYLDISDMREEDLDVSYEPKYCPDCGAKVVDK